VSITETNHSDHGSPDGASGGQGDVAGQFGLELLQADPRTLAAR